MSAFPIRCYSIDLDKGWVICEVLNRMQNLGDDEIYAGLAITLLKYAGNGLFSSEEVAFDRQSMGAMLVRWLQAREKMVAQATRA